MSALIVLPESFWVICPCSFPASKSKFCSITAIRQEEMDSGTGCRQGFSSQDKKHLLTTLIKISQCTLPGTHKKVNISLEKTLDCDFLSPELGPLLARTSCYAICHEVTHSDVLISQVKDVKIKIVLLKAAVSRQLWSMCAEG